MGMDEKTAGLLEQSVARALTLLGTQSAPRSAAAPAQESGQEDAHGPDARDAGLIAARIQATSNLDPAAATAIANDLVDRAAKALSRLAQSRRIADVDEEEALALESVMQVRGRPAIRVLANHLESLKNHPGSEFWQEFIAMYEERIVASAAATGAVIVSSFASGNPPWLQGSAWLVAPDRVVTNRHVLLPDNPEAQVATPDARSGKLQFRGDFGVTIEFAADDRTPSRKIPRRVTEILYCARPQDPADIALLAIEPPYEEAPLQIATVEDAAPDNLFLVGHPALMAKIPEAVQAVFGKLDGRKRVSFGKRLNGAGLHGTLPYDASTVGGFSGAPVIGISDGTVAGLHYYGNPIAGNLAIPARTLRAHTSYQWIAGRGT